MAQNSSQENDNDSTARESEPIERTIVIHGQHCPVSHVADMCGLDIDEPPATNDAMFPDQGDCWHKNI